MQIAYGTSGIPWVRSLEGVEVLESGIGEAEGDEERGRAGAGGHGQAHRLS